MCLSRTKPATTTTTTLLVTFFVFSCIVLSCTNIGTTNWSDIYASVFLISGVLFMSTLLLVAARATMVTLITVLVLLAFAGKCRRVLVQQGRKIATDVVMYLAKGSA